MPSLLQRQGVLVGVKADAGLAPFDGPGSLEGDTVTRGLERLPEACARWKKEGAAFTKWRAALKVHRREQERQKSGPSDALSPSSSSFGVSPAAVAANAEQLARYAAISQSRGLVPIVEPELLIDGEHSAEAAAAAKVQGFLFEGREIEREREKTKFTLSFDPRLFTLFNNNNKKKNFKNLVINRRS